MVKIRKKLIMGGEKLKRFMLEGGGAARGDLVPCTWWFVILWVGCAVAMVLVV